MTYTDNKNENLFHYADGIHEINDSNGNTMHEGDGVGKEEFVTFMKEEFGMERSEALELFNSVDNGDGKLNLDEFNRALNRASETLHGPTGVLPGDDSIVSFD